MALLVCSLYCPTAARDKFILLIEFSDSIAADTTSLTANAPAIALPAAIAAVVINLRELPRDAPNPEIDFKEDEDDVPAFPKPDNDFSKLLICLELESSPVILISTLTSF